MTSKLNLKIMRKIFGILIFSVTLTLNVKAQEASKENVVLQEQKYWLNLLNARE